MRSPLFRLTVSVLLFSASTLVFGIGTAAAQSFKLRLAKAPDPSDANSPATLAYQHNDGAKSDFVTQGAAIWNHDVDDLLSIAPSVAWNRNTLASTPTDTWKASLGAARLWFYNCPTCEHNLNRVKWSASIGQQRDLTKSASAVTGRLDATLFIHQLENPPGGTLDFAALRPTVTLFAKHVYDAAPDKITGLTPTGTMSGSALGLVAYVQMKRWHIDASSQNVHVTRDVNGSAPRLHRLSKVSLRYEFVDAARTGEQLKRTATQWIPSVMLSRQVGDDPFNDVGKAGLTQIAFCLQY